MRSPSTRRIRALALLALAAPACAPTSRRDASVVEDSPSVSTDVLAPDAPTPDAAPPSPDALTPDVPALDAAMRSDVLAPDVLASDASDVITFDTLASDTFSSDTPIVDAPSPADSSADSIAPYNSTCMRPVRSLVNGDEVVARATGPSRESSHDCARSAPGPEDYYTFYNGSPSRWFFTTDDPRSEGTHLLLVRESCANPLSDRDGCATNNGARMGTATLTMTEFSRTGFALVVDRTDSAEPFNYVLRARQVTLAMNARCYAPQSRVIAANGATVTGENLEAADDDEATCDQVSDAPQLFYRINVPAMTQVTITATPVGPMPLTWRPRVRVGTQCYLNCTDLNTATAPGVPARAVAVNSDAVERLFWVSVGAADANVFGTYRITTASGTIATGDSCSAPEPLVPGTPLRARSTSDDTSTGFGCGITDAGGQKHYAVTVPPGRRLRVTLTPTGDPWTAVLRRFENCPATLCTEASVSSAPNAPVTLRFENPGDAPRTFVFAASARGRGAHSYDLEAETLPAILPYVETRVGARCDTLSGAATRLLGAPADNVNTEVRPLPFAFEYFAQRQTHFALSSNGFMQLFASAGASPVSMPVTSVLPDAAAPPGLLAPYWADLSARPTVGELRAGEVSDALGRRFVAHWNGFQVVGYPDTQLSFQVKLFEASRAVEFHWCALAPISVMSGSVNPVLGQYSTTGLQDPNGIEGITSARNRAATLDTTVALRYAPRL